MKRVSLGLIALMGMMLSACGVATPTPTVVPTIAATDTPRPTPTVTPTLIPTPTPTPLASWETTPEFEPALGQIAYVSNVSGHDQIYVVNTDGSDPIALTHDEYENRDPAWSPDGRKIAYTRIMGLTEEEVNGGSVTRSLDSAEIVVMNADGSDPVSITQALAAQNLAAFNAVWSPNGRTIAFNAAQVDQMGNSFAGWNLYVMNADGSGEPIVLTNWEPNSGVGCYGPAWLADSRRIVIYCRALMQGGALIYSVSGGEGQTLFEGQGARFYGSSVSGVLAISEGTYVVTARGVDYADLTRLALDLPMLSSGYQPAVTGLAWSPTLDLLAVRYTSGLAIIRADGFSQNILVSDLAEDDFSEGISWSPDGSQIVIDALIEGHSDLLIASVDGDGVIRLTASEVEENDPAWGP